MTAANIAASGNCIGNTYLVAAGNDGACNAAVPADTFNANATNLLGPISASGGTISHLEVVTDGVAAVGKTPTIDVMDNTTGAVLLSCTIDTTTSLSTSACRNTGSAAVTAGHYVQVGVTENGQSHKQYRVTFRY